MPARAFLGETEKLLTTEGEPGGSLWEGGWRRSPTGEACLWGTRSASQETGPWRLNPLAFRGERRSLHAFSHI